VGRASRGDRVRLVAGAHYRLGTELRRAIGDDVVVIGDGGDVVAAVSRVLRVRTPGHWLDPGPFGCLGVGLPYALGVAAARPDAAVVHADGYKITEGNEIIEYDGAMKDMPTITMLLRGGHDVATSGSLFRKACFDAVGGYNEQLPVWEDIDLAIRLYQRFPLAHLPKPLYRHRLYGHNVSRDIPSERALLGRQRFLEKHAPSCKPDTPEARALASDWAHYYGDLGKHNLQAGRIKEARRGFWLSLRYQPFNRKVLLRLLRSYFVHTSQTKHKVEMEVQSPEP